MEAHEDDTYARLKAAMEEAEASESPPVTAGAAIWRLP